MFWRKKKPVERCKHTSKFGESHPDNMKTIIRFNAFKKSAYDINSYKIYQCTKCGKRAFGIHGLHLMCDQTTDIIDGFIGYRLPLIDLINRFEKLKYRFMIRHDRLGKHNG